MQLAYYIEYGYHYLEHIQALYNVAPGIMITLFPKTAELLRNKCPIVRLGKSHDKELLKQLDVDVVVYSGCRAIPKHADKFHVLVCHGVSDKTLIKSLGGNFNLVLLPGMRDYERIQSTGANMGKYKISGYNKFSLLKNMRPQNLFANGKKTILYSPTWNYSVLSGVPEINSSWKYVAEICKAIGEDYNLIIKPHPIINMMISGNLYEQLKDPRWNNIKYISDYQSLPYMLMSDLMITDISSTAYEWLYFNKPIIFINPNPMELRVGLEETKVWDCGKVVNDIKLLRRMIDHCFANLDEHREIREKYLNYAYSRPRDGQAAIRAINIIKQGYQKYKGIPRQLKLGG